MRDDAAKENPGINKVPALNAEDIANSIIHVLGVPPHVEILELTLLAKEM